MINIKIPTPPFLFLKTRGDFDSQRYAVLLSPNLREQVTNDTELYQAINERGSALIWEIFCFQPIGQPQTLSPEQFKENWRGD